MFGTLWIFTTKYYVNPTKFEIIVLDNNNKQIKNSNMRTVFKIRDVALSYVEEYQKEFPGYNFLLKESQLQFKRRWLSVLKNQR